MKICCRATFRKIKNSQLWMVEKKNGKRKPQCDDGCIENAHGYFDFDIVENIFIYIFHRYTRTWSIVCQLCSFSFVRLLCRDTWKCFTFYARADQIFRCCHRSNKTRKKCIFMWNVLSFMHCISHMNWKSLSRVAKDRESFQMYKRWYAKWNRIETKEKTSQRKHFFIKLDEYGCNSFKLIARKVLVRTHQR